MKTFLLLSLLLVPILHAAPPTAEDDKAISGTWKVNPPRSSRIYEISEGRTLKISGGSRSDKRERLIPQDDGTYLVKLESGVLRITHDKERNRLVVELFGGDDDIKKGVSPIWKVPGTRHEKSD